MYGSISPWMIAAYVRCARCKDAMTMTYKDFAGHHCGKPIFRFRIVHRSWLVRLWTWIKRKIRRVW